MLAIRSAAPADARAIARLYIESWRVTYAGLLPGDRLARMSERGQTASWAGAIEHGADREIVLVATAPDAAVVAVGSAGSSRHRDLPYGGEIYTLYVDQDFQGLGLGRRLLLALMRALHGRGQESVLIWVLADNPSRYFYQAMGGKPVAERVERMWGVDVRQVGYGWRDLPRVIAALRRGVAEATSKGTESRS